jgi:DNA (cytosine-5)-methyltransferase 1
VTETTFGSVCSGIEAASVAWEPLGFWAEWFSEIEAFPSAVLAHHWPDVPNLGDMLTLPALVDAGKIAAPDVLVGGTPCQAFSVAGNRESLADARGGLTLAYVELADAIDRQRAREGQEPCVIVWENVPGVLSTKDNAFGCFLAGLAGEDVPLQPPGKRWTNAGIVLGPKRAVAWRILDAQYFGVAQLRRRVFVVASARDGFDPSAVLLEFDGVRRDSAPRREARKETAGDAVPGATGASGHPYHDVALCLNAGGMGRIDYESESMVVQTCLPVNTQIATRGGALGERTGFGIGEHGDPAFTLQAAHSHGVAHTVALRGRDGGATAELGGEIATALRASNGGGDKPHVLATMDVAGTMKACAGKTGGWTNSADHAAAGYMQVDADMAVRRLTPRECERLQGFPDDHTMIPVGQKLKSEVKEELARYFERTGQYMREVSSGQWELDRAAFEAAWPAMAADGPRYKALGNSMAVPVMRWIGQRIIQQLNGEI